MREIRITIATIETSDLNWIFKKDSLVATNRVTVVKNTSIKKKLTSIPIVVLAFSSGVRK